MASNINYRSSRRSGRVAFANANAPARRRSSLSGALPLTDEHLSRRRSQYREVPELVLPANDRRLYNPDPEPSYKRLSGRPARVVAVPVRKIRQTSHLDPEMGLHNPLPQLLFQQASGVTVCVQRKTRKEVIHAKGVAGTKVAKPKMRHSSKIKCNYYG